ncbi:hypothetical protein [Methylobacterium brachiatum]|uniref:DUF4440 domain-containing protein n=1 Tax=Methylobacterium brachiatum TaxID=269660 RepID=A0ABV1R6N1_9HYPH
MRQRRLTTALLVLLLPGGKPAAAAPAPTAMAAPGLVRPAATRADLPSGACDKTEDGFTAFLNAIVTDPALRAAYSAPQIAERDLNDPARPVARPIEPFRLTLIDYMWSYDEPGRDPGKLARVELSFTLDGDRMRLGLVRAKFSPEGNLVRTFGAPEAYVFEHRQGCWRLVEHLR